MSTPEHLSMYEIEERARSLRAEAMRDILASFSAFLRGAISTKAPSRAT